jgi:hypothetical protein
MRQDMRGIILSFAVFLGACGGSSGGGSSSSDQMQIGSRWSSPLSVGIYDDDNGTLVIYTHLDRQVAALQYADDYLADAVGDYGCESALDVSDGVASVSDTKCTLHFQAGGRRHRCDRIIALPTGERRTQRLDALREARAGRTKGRLFG